jgi:hypothetical protein
MHQVEMESGAARERVESLLGLVKKNAREIDPDYDGRLSFASLLPQAADAFAALHGYRPRDASSSS